MATEYTIDTALYEQALEQIKAAYLKEHPVTPRSMDSMLPALDEHATYVFGLAWQTAVDGHESDKSHRAGMLQQQLQPLDEKCLASLSPRDQERMRERHAELEKRMRERMEATNKHMVDHQRTMFVALFTKSGVEQALAEKILDEHILFR